MFLELDDIESWEYVTDCEKVYDIEVESTHNYFIHAGKDILVHNSSKTYSIMQLICTMAIEQRLTIHIVGQDFPNLYIGPISDLKTLIADSEILRACLKNPNLDKGPFKFKNGSIIKFVTVQTQQDAKSGKRDILFINEANGLSYDIAFELIARTKKKVFIDFNPNARFWVHYELVGQPDVDFIISNFTHNQFLPEKIKDQIFQWKEKYERTGSVYWKNKWMVYGLGKTGSVEGVVFDHINYTNFFPLSAKHVTYGLDFGFKNNHTALIKIGYYDKAMYGKEILYEQKLNSFQLAERLLAIGITKDDKIIADPANNEAISILQSKGFNIVPAKKGADSIKAGIELIQSMPLFITNDSKNWMIEIENYKYKKDTNGKFTNTPIDDYNDCFIAGTQVLTIDGPKAIETIEIGEQILTSEGYNKVVRTWDNGVKEVSEYTLIFEDREIVVTCTDKHKIKTTTGWKQIQELQKQEVLYLVNNTDSLGVQKAVLRSIQRISKGSQPAYDLMIENCHEYFVDTLLVSNCHDAARYVYTELFGLRLKKADNVARQKFVRKVSVI